MMQQQTRFASSKCAAAWCMLERERGTVYRQHTGLRIECSMVRHGIVCELAFIYSPIHSPYHIEFFSSDSNRMVHLAAVLTDHV